MRSDAQQNRDRVLAAARAEFTAHGPAASLNKIAQRAGVGPGTLYRHFPTAAALLAAIIAEDVAKLCATGRELLGHPDPARGLHDWLRAVAVHATAMRGLVATESLDAAGSALAECHDEIRAVGAALLERAGAGDGVDDVLTVVNAVAWASERLPAVPGRLERLLDLVTRGLPAPTG
ncbi:TetR family transcriptional regulator [Actinoplanes italicus]|uniref:TetR family transcriptional regulator n=1 Tax=Actinoplanes italicus TaxID=113567 RepID=A0A2T0KGR6_9ACTN|nr:TetR/AcrR family transcriptional regulator [Actinoplanes italicus]PRX22630.1 TetR family transcriptional regulator [Actinoplanes italicus]GIE28150.1 TetR family transcriptional regulator [Actinoplanes italicus]